MHAHVSQELYLLSEALVVNPESSHTASTLQFCYELAMYNL